MEQKGREETINTGFQVDIISESLRELQQEKKKLENFLENERARRKDTEAKLNLVNARFSNVQERHSRVLAARDIAKQKMKDSEDLLTKLQNMNIAKEKEITDIKHQIDEEKVKKEKRCTEFSQQLDELAKQFFNAYNCFDESSLLRQGEELERKITETAQAAEESKAQIEDLTNQLSECTIIQDEKSALDDEDWLSIEEAEIALNLFKDENDRIQSQYDICHGELVGVQTRVNEMMEKCNKTETVLET